MELETFLDRLKGVRRNGDGSAMALCPAHDDHEPSLSVKEGDDGRLLVRCFAGCKVEGIVSALGLSLADLFPCNGSSPDLNFRPANVQTSLGTAQGITLEQFAAAKHLPVDFLSGLGWVDVRRKGIPAIKIPYLSEAGDVCGLRYRMAMTGHRFEWQTGDHAMPYGLDRLPEIRKAGWCLIVEGESDAATAWYFNIPCLGLPGKGTWKAEWVTYLRGVDIFGWQEPDAESFTQKLGASFSNLRVIESPEGVKDLSEAHLQGRVIPTFLAVLKGRAALFQDMLRESQSVAAARLKTGAAVVLQADDPLVLVEQTLRRLGYGGDIKPALITYLAATSRLLCMRPGAMPVHLLLVGPPSAGKSYTLGLVLRLLPDEGYHVIEAGSPRVLIYDTADLRHRLLVFGEADSLPSDEDNPASSAVRNLLQDHRLHYRTTVRDKETGSFTVAEINKPGPTVLVTTAVRRLGAQLDSRLFSLEVPDGQQQLRSALETQARIELSGAIEPPDSLILFQAYLQALAPWDVVVPFADKLSTALANSPVSARASRDYARLLSLVKSVAVLRHTRRSRDNKGRLVAVVDDYRTVFGLVADMYAGSATGAGAKVREVVAAVTTLVAEGKLPVRVSDVARKLGANVPAISRRVKDAITGGWLVNEEARKGAPANLVVGEALPEKAGLLDPSDLGYEDVCTFAPLTGGSKAEVLMEAGPVPRPVEDVLRIV